MELVLQASALLPFLSSFHALIVDATRAYAGYVFPLMTIAIFVYAGSTHRSLPLLAAITVLPARAVEGSRLMPNPVHGLQPAFFNEARLDRRDVRLAVATCMTE